MFSEKILIEKVKKSVRVLIFVLAVMMIPVICWGTLDVAILIYEQLKAEPFLRLGTEHLLTVFGSFLTVLIGIEIFMNILLFLSQKTFHVQLVVATALTAIARKVIVLDYATTNSLLIFSIAAVVVSLSLAYWVSLQEEKEE